MSPFEGITPDRTANGVVALVVALGLVLATISFYLASALPDGPEWFGANPFFWVGVAQLLSVAGALLLWSRIRSDVGADPK